MGDAGRIPLRSGPSDGDAPAAESTRPTELEQNGTETFRLAGREEGGPDTGVSRPPRDRRSEPLSGDGTRGAAHGPSPT